MFDPDLAKELLAMFEVVRDTRQAAPLVVRKQLVTRAVVPSLVPPITS